jgi:dihydroceramide fatty acyl 2-hydroxylase
MSVQAQIERKPASCRMFETPLIERFSRIHPATPFLFWIPILAFILVRANVAGAAGQGAEGLGGAVLGAPAQIGLLLCGVLIWSLVEYGLHRYVFHYQGPKPWQRRVFFIIHGVHHDYPQDVGRLVMPLGASIPLAAVFYGLFHLVVGPVLLPPLFVGFGIGYLAYDGIHYAVHHFKMTSRIGRWLKRHHMVHHHTGEQARWGVSSPLWDYVFGTMGSPVRSGEPTGR